MTSSKMPFAARLTKATAARGRLCVGIDPHPASLAAWGLKDDLTGLETFSRGMVAALAGNVACFKPQSAFFEAYGSAGMSVLAYVLHDIAAAGAISILDAKRGDIGSTMSAYAKAYLSDGAPLAADAITLSPFLGFGSLTPAIDVATQTGRGVFVLVRTSNPEGAQVQLAKEESLLAGSLSGFSPSVAQRIVTSAASVNTQAGTPVVGLVVGATLGSLDVGLRGFDGWILAPGIGAQGGDITRLTKLFGSVISHVLPTVSRSVADAGPSPRALRSAVRQLLSAAAASQAEASR